MEDYPKTLLDFEKRFATEEACRDYLCQLRWPEDSGYQARKEERYFATLELNTIYSRIGSQAYNPK